MAEAGQAAEWGPKGWQRHTFPHHGHSHAFYVIDRGQPGTARPSVMLLHEFPGIKPDLVQLANTLAENFRVVVPSIFGHDGEPKAAGSLKQICVQREVHLLARHTVSASVGWLRDFADEHVARRRNEPYGVIGMCFTGNFALALAVDPRVTAAVLAQPSIPVWPWALGLSPEDRETLQNRTGLRAQGYRYRCDWMSPAAKLEAAERLLGPDKMKIFPLSRNSKQRHSTLTGACPSPVAIAGIQSFLAERLAATPRYDRQSDSTPDE